MYAAAAAAAAAAAGSRNTDRYGVNLNPRPNRVLLSRAYYDYDFRLNDRSSRGTSSNSTNSRVPLWE